MEKDSIKIRETNKVYLGQIWKDILSDNEIYSVILNKKDSSYLTFGEIELYVKKADFEKAKSIIENIKN